MGQSQTKIKDPASSKPGRKRSQTASFSQSVMGLFGETCSYLKCPPESEVNNLTWKDHMIEQFRFYKNEEWAVAMANFLTRQSTEAEDAMFQSDLFWADLNKASVSSTYSTNPYSFVRNQKTGPLNPTAAETDEALDNNEKKVVHQLGIDENKKIDFFKDIRDMLETSDILDEKILSTSNKETWMDKAYDIKINPKKFSYAASIEARRLPSSPQDSPKKVKSSLQSPKKMKSSADPTQVFNAEAMRLSFDYYKSPLAAKNVSSNTDMSPPSSAHSFKNSLDEYNNNTFVCHSPLEEQDKSPLNKEEVNQQNEEDIYKALVDYRMVTDIIDKHLKNPMNPFCRLIGCFESYFNEAYGDVDQSGEKKEKVLPSEAKEQTERATKELQQFIRILYEGVNIFYRLEKLKISRKQPSNVILFSKDNTINFLTSIVFTQKIHDVIFKLYQFQSFPVEEAFEKNRKRSDKKQPQDFGVSVLYSLNEKTIQLLKQKDRIPQLRLRDNRIYSKRLHFENDNAVESDFKLLSPKDVDDKNKEFFLSVEGKAEDPDKIEDLEMEIKNREDPYIPAIKMMGNLDRRKSPIHKLKTIVKVAELASIAVDNFYKDLLIESFKKLDSDQTLYIFMYILVKSKLTDVIAHCRIIQNFSTGHILDSISGYYATTLEACVNILSGMNIEETTTEDVMSPTEGSQVTYQRSMPSHFGSKKEDGVSSMS